jgi:hypothetical protein
MKDEVVQDYLNNIKTEFQTGHAREHAYRPALKKMLDSVDDTLAVNDPKRSEHGNPDFILFKNSNRAVIVGYGEAKDIDVVLDKIEKTGQMERYAGYNKLFLTNYLEFRFYQNGEKYRTISVGQLKNGQIEPKPDQFQALYNELKEFMELPPERITRAGVFVITFASSLSSPVTKTPN